MEQPQIISKYMGIIPACCSCRSSTGWHCGSTAGRKGEGSGLRGGWEVWWFAPQEENSPLQWSVNYLELSLKLFKIVNFQISFKNSHQTEVFHILKGFVSTKTKCKFQRIPVLQTPLRHPTLVSRISPSSHTWDYCCQEQCYGETIMAVNFHFSVT